MTSNLKDTFRGCMVGLAVGDALGAACEFMKQRQVRTVHGILWDYCETAYFDAGEFTDDTCLALAIAESIIEAGSVDYEVIADAFVQWMHTDGRGIGLLTLDALQMIDGGTPSLHVGLRAWGKSGKTSAGNGAVMRCAPIGLLNYKDEDALIEDSVMVSRITHYDPRCCWSSVAVNAAIAAIVRGQDPFAAAHRLVKGKCSELESALSAAETQDVEYMTLDGADMGYTILTTQVAFVALRQFDGFENALVSVVNKGGDADTNGAVAGALLAEIWIQRHPAALDRRAQRT